MAPSLHDLLSVKVEKAYLQNLDTGQLEPFLFNPEEFEERYRANYARHESLGLSHQRMQFLHGSNPQINLEVTYDQLVVDNRNRSTLERLPSEASINDAEKWRRFILSLLPPRRSRILKSASPPPVLFVWPGMISMRVRLTFARIRHRMFATRKPRARLYVASLVLEEEVLERYYSSDVIRRGTYRPWATSNVTRSG